MNPVNCRENWILNTNSQLNSTRFVST